MKNKKLNIAGNTWTVKYVTPAKMPLRGIEGAAVWPTRVIYIDKEITGELLKIVLLHEIRHAYQFETGMAQVLDSQAMEIDADGFASLIMSLKAQKII